MSFLLVRSSDLVLLGVSWTGMSMSATAAGQPTALQAGASARLIVTFPPQHVEEETSLPKSPAPLTLVSAAGGVPGWRAMLSGTSQLTVAVDAGTVIPLTAEGILGALAQGHVVVSNTPGPQDTALNLPSRLTVIPLSPTSASVVCRHPADVGNDTTPMWRTRLSRSDNAKDGDIGLTATGFDSQEPGYAVPLGAVQRSDIVDAMRTAPALVRRLDLSTLGATLDVAGTWASFAWEHHCVLGRDIKVRTLTKGALYPFGHQAQLIQTTSRRFDPDVGGAAVLRSESVVVVTEPIRSASSDASTRRAFPFTSVEVLATLVAVTPEAIAWIPFNFHGVTKPAYFRVADQTGKPVGFSVLLRNPARDVHAVVPLIFVADLTSEGIDSLDDPALTAALSTAYGTTTVPVPGGVLNLVDASTGAPGDTHEVQQISLVGLPTATLPAPVGGYRAAVSAMQVHTPALRSLLGDTTPRSMQFAPDYLHGSETDVLLLIDQAQKIDVNFTKMTDRCGALVAPRYVADAISRTTGPVNQAAQAAAATGGSLAEALFPSDATILGYPMSSLLADVREAPRITATLASGTGPQVSMTWSNVALKGIPGFLTEDGSTMDLTVNTGPGGTATHCSISNFKLQFPAVGDPVLTLSFQTIVYDQANGGAPHLSVAGVSAQFTGDLTVVQMLADVIHDALGPAAGPLDTVGQLVSVTRDGISVQYTYAVPPVPAGVFVMRNIGFTTEIDVPFTGDPPTVQVGFSSQANPFQLTVLMLGGSGYADIVVDHNGIQRFDAALEFGAMAAVDFVVARGEIHVFGGIAFSEDAKGSVKVTGYLRLGGMVEVLGLVSVTIEARIELSYESARNALVGKATFVVTIDLTLWSSHMEISTGEWVLTGGTPHPHALMAFRPGSPHSLTDAAPAAFDGLAQWRLYRQSFSTPPATPPVGAAVEASQ
jgi:hypothetical protein